MKAQFPDEETESGEFKRQTDTFRKWISNDGSTPHAAETARYHLYVSLACPWASRTIIFRKIKGLEDAIGMTIVDPFRDQKGWAFRDPERSRPGSPLNKLDKFESTDPFNGFRYLSEAYAATDPKFNERVTVPVLLVWGERDAMVSVAGAERVSAALPETQIELLDGIGHCPQIEAADRVAELLLSFPASLRRAA